ncbi:MerR family transcriptional regulator [Nesterenkonia pannonica]|uniref:helix-turn-helix domain-containing protein n=1 Tax=Nesterenkonia pannonica TaxID=1548602 RepID=UPI0021645BB3|nr:MerR family transcriptional regulator [Nesterenkonia pannonica]
MRALRHYHQIGLLEEPERSSNGYRDYGTHALVTVLRIRRLADLGFSLPQISTMLEGTEPPPAEVFDALDAEFASQIDRLTHQRELLAHLRQYEALPDLPPQIASFHHLLLRSGLTGSAASVDRDHTLLLMHLMGSQGQGYLTAIYELLSHPHRASTAAAAMTAWADLDDEASREEIMALAEQITELFLPVVAELAAQDAPELPAPPDAWFSQHTTDYLSSGQRAVLDTVRSALEGRHDGTSAPPDT